MEEAIDIYFTIFNAKLAFNNIMSIYILNKYTKESSEKRKSSQDNCHSIISAKLKGRGIRKMSQKRAIKVSTQEHPCHLTD